MISHEQAKQHLQYYKKHGLKAQTVGGVYKKHPKVHDIDLIVHRRYLPHTQKLLKGHKTGVPIDVYVAEKGTSHKRLKRTLRNPTYNVIKEKQMKGLKYQRHIYEDYPTNSWRMWKRAQRANPLKGKKCDMCGVDNAKLNRHHTSAQGSEDIRVVCSRCHSKLHREVNKMSEIDYLIQLGENYMFQKIFNYQER